MNWVMPPSPWTPDAFQTGREIPLKAIPPEVFEKLTYGEQELAGRWTPKGATVLRVSRHAPIPERAPAKIRFSLELVDDGNLWDLAHFAPRDYRNLIRLYADCTIAPRLDDRWVIVPEPSAFASQEEQRDPVNFAVLPMPTNAVLWLGSALFNPWEMDGLWAGKILRPGRLEGARALYAGDKDGWAAFRLGLPKSDPVPSAHMVDAELTRARLFWQPFEDPKGAGELQWEHVVEGVERHPEGSSTANVYLRAVPSTKE